MHVRELTCNSVQLPKPPGKEGREANVPLRGDHAVAWATCLSWGIGHEAAQDIVVVAQDRVTEHCAGMRKGIVRLPGMPAR
eukprot:2257036-Alexandrium_andersonii.AAC.1